MVVLALGDPRACRTRETMIAAAFGVLEHEPALVHLLTRCMKLNYRKRPCFAEVRHVLRGGEPPVPAAALEEAPGPVAVPLCEALVTAVFRPRDDEQAVLTAAIQGGPALFTHGLHG
jgi:hypothetical protein